jgi:hypothetical protein
VPMLLVMKWSAVTVMCKWTSMSWIEGWWSCLRHQY